MIGDDNHIRLGSQPADKVGSQVSKAAGSAQMGRGLLKQLAPSLAAQAFVLRRSDIVWTEMGNAAAGDFIACCSRTQLLLEIKEAHQSICINAHARLHA